MLNLIARSALMGVSAIAFATSPANAQSAIENESATPRWEVVVGPFAVHWSNEEAHSRVFLLGVERTDADQTFWGVSLFRNSFAQPCAYAYYGYRWDGLFGQPSLFFKFSGGVIYGYKDEYEDKVPFNRNGLGLAAIPAIGYQLSTRDAVQVVVLGKAAVLLTYNRRF